MARGRTAEDRSVDILNAARTLLLEQGPSHMTMDAIAARAGVGKGTIFLYWPSKDRLLNALFNLGLAEILLGVNAELNRHPNAGRLSVTLRHVLAAQLAHPTVNALLRGGNELSSWDDSALALALREILSILRGQGLLKLLPDEEIALGVEAVIFGILRVHAEGRSCSTGIDLAVMFERIVAAAYEADTPPAAALQRAAIEIGQAFDRLIDALVKEATPTRKAVPSSCQPVDRTVLFMGTKTD
jgi:AcrR family transcriptional regulator